MFAFIITIHAIACVLLILIVLIQQGKGGGLIDSMSSAESVFGTKTNTFLIKATSILSVVFFVTCLSLAFLSIQKNKSLIETSYKPTAKAKAAVTTTSTATPAATPITKQTVTSQASAPLQTQLPSALTEKKQDAPQQQVKNEKPVELSK